MPTRTQYDKTKMVADGADLGWCISPWRPCRHHLGKRSEETLRHKAKRSPMGTPIVGACACPDNQ